jgi:chaperonin GroES
MKKCIFEGCATAIVTPMHPDGTVNEQRFKELIEEQIKGGIFIPDTAKEKPQEGKVIALGIKRDEAGKELPFDVKVGDTVLMPKYGGTEVKMGDKTYQIVREEDILGVID